jgi:predicted RNA-binding Zn-ribbon protein involved in translation (DUF1610 family)
MAQNKIQSQKGSSLQGLAVRHPAQCADELELERGRWPQGFVCPDCGEAAAPVRLRTRALH